MYSSRDNHLSYDGFTRCGYFSFRFPAMGDAYTIQRTGFMDEDDSIWNCGWIARSFNNLERKETLEQD